MEELYKLKEMLLRELKEYAHKNELSASARVDVHMLTDTIKNICKILMLEELSEDDSSYEPGESYAGRSSRRDARGRYSRDGGSSRNGGSYGGSYEGGGSSRRGGSYGGGYSERGRSRASYSEGEEEVRRMMHEAMDTAQNPEMREKIRKCIEEMERM